MPGGYEVETNKKKHMQDLKAWVMALIYYRYSWRYVLYQLGIRHLVSQAEDPLPPEISTTTTGISGKFLGNTIYSTTQKLHRNCPSCALLNLRPEMESSDEVLWEPQGRA